MSIELHSEKGYQSVEQHSLIKILSHINLYNELISFHYFIQVKLIPKFILDQKIIISVNPKRTKTVCKDSSLDFITFVHVVFLFTSPLTLQWMGNFLFLLQCALNINYVVCLGQRKQENGTYQCRS